MQFILASASPRRRELMEMLGVTDLVIRPAVGEEHADPSLAPPQLCMALAEGKAREIAALPRVMDKDTYLKYKEQMNSTEEYHYDQA